MVEPERSISRSVGRGARSLGVPMLHSGWTRWLILAAVLVTPLGVRADWEDYCPWVGSSYLAKSCGNGVCDGVSPDIETAVNCPIDCNSSLVMSYYSQDTYCPYVQQVV